MGRKGGLGLSVFVFCFVSFLLYMPDPNVQENNLKGSNIKPCLAGSCGKVLGDIFMPLKK